MQEFLVDEYLKNTNRDDLELKQKLTRLCNTTNSSFVLFFTSIKTTTVKTRYVVMSDEILKKYPKLSIEGSRLPGGDLYLVGGLGLCPETQRVMLYFAGCSGGVAGLRVAKDIAENNLVSRVLLATSETTIIGIKPPSADRPYDLVGVTLLGDGTRAVIVGTHPIPVTESPLFELHTAIQNFLPNTEKTVDGTLTEEGLKITLRDSDYNKMFWSIHPGGPAILNRMMEKRFGLLPDKLNASRIALMDYGNASSNTIVYVLEYMIEESRMMQAGSENCDWGLILVSDLELPWREFLQETLLS
ncbi:chalcone and stilbene synthase family protein [Salix suchowensis]|nr:chalcone and stilbene synthase family protein [Salix suchowensis]